MPTMIDSLLISLSLDPSNFVKGQRDAVASMGKTKEASVKSAKETETAVRGMADGVGAATRQVLTLFAVLAGARSLKDFVSDVVSSDTALGNLARTLGVAPSTVSSFAMAVERSGGSVSEATASFQSLNDAVNELKTTGNSALLPLFAKLKSASGVQIDLNKGTRATILDLAEALSKLAAKDPSMAGYLGRQITGSTSVTAFLEQGRANAQAAMDATDKYAPTPEQIAAQQKLTASWNALSQAITSVGRDIEVVFAPAVSSVLSWMEQWIAKNKGWLDQKIGDAIAAFATAVGEFVSSPEFKELISYVSDPTTWKPFSDWVHQMGQADTWKGFKGAVGWLAGQLHEIIALIKTIRDFSNWLDDKTGLHFEGAHDALLPAQKDKDALAEGPYVDLERESGFVPRLKRAWKNGIFGGGPKDSHPRPGRLPADRQANAQAAIDELRKAGYNDNAIAAVIGSMQTESSFNPRAHNSVSGGHTGAWQWDSTRWPKIAAWIRSQGGDPADFRWQTKAWVAEHNARPGDAIYDTQKTEAGGAILRGNPSLSAAVHGVQLSERFGVGEEGGRAANASNWLPRIAAKPQAPLTRRFVTTMPPNPRASAHSTFGQALPGMHAAISSLRTATTPVPNHATGMIGLRAASHIANDNRVSNAGDVNVGHITVNTQAQDAHGVAAALKPILAGNTRTAGYNSGPK